MYELFQEAQAVIKEVQKAVVGKDDVIEKIMMAIIANGHILIEDIPGVGKTTMALSFSKAMGVSERRMQFTPDVMPADLTGFNVYKKETGEFVYQPGAVICNLFLADEINRTSPKTQSALLEVMEERQVTVDGTTWKTGNPFIVIATENPEGSAGTQLLPESQLDRFMICIRMGYPTVEEEIEILKRRQCGNPVDIVKNITKGEKIIEMQKAVSQVFVHDVIYKYIASLAKETREHTMLASGISPRGTVAMAAMSRAAAWIKGHDYVLPEDVKGIFTATAAHRVRLNTKAKVGHVQVEDVLDQILLQVKEPSIRENR